MEINYLAIFISAIIGMAIGALWYGPLFGKKWMKLTGITKKEMKKTPQVEMQKMYFMGFLIHLVLSFALFMLATYLGKETAWEWAKTGALVGLLFIAPASKSSYVWEKRPLKLWWINALYFVVVLGIAGYVMALI